MSAKKSPQIWRALFVIVLAGPFIVIRSAEWLRKRRLFRFMLALVMAAICLTAITVPHVLPIVLLFFGPGFLWMILPVFIPLAPFRSPLMRALRQSLLQEKIARGVRTGIVLDAIPGFLEPGSPLDASERLLEREGFKLQSARVLSEDEAVKWNASNSTEMRVFERMTHVHPLGAFKVEIRLFSDRDKIVRRVRAFPFYDGV